MAKRGPNARPITDAVIVEAMELICGQGGQACLTAQGAANFVGITRQTLYRRMKEHGYDTVKALRADHTRRGSRERRADPNAPPPVLIPELPPPPPSTPVEISPKRIARQPPKKKRRMAISPERQPRRKRIEPGFAHLELDDTGVSMPAEMVRLLTGDLIDVIEKEAKSRPDSRLMVCTGGISIPHAERLAKLKVVDLRIIVDAGILRIVAKGIDRAREGKRADAGYSKIAKLREIFGGRIRFVENHIKAVCFSGGGKPTAILTSANLNPNNNEEQIEDAAGLSIHLERMFDDVFAGMSDTLSDSEAVDSDASRAGRLLAVVSLAKSMRDITAAQGAFEDEFYTAAGMVYFLNEAVKGKRGLTVTISTWGVTWRLIYELSRLKSAGVIGRLKLIIAPKLATAKSKESRQAYAAIMDLIPDDVVWSNTHAKVVVITGDGVTAAATGTANYNRVASMLNIIRVQTDVGAVTAAQALVNDLQSEFEPPAPREGDIEAVRSLVQKAQRTVTKAERAAVMGQASSASGVGASGNAVDGAIPVQNLAVDYDLISIAHAQISDEQLELICRAALKGLGIDAAANYAGVNPRRLRTVLKAWERERTKSPDYLVGRAFYGHSARVEFGVKHRLLTLVQLGDTRAAAMIIDAMDEMPAIRADENPTTAASVETMKAAKARRIALKREQLAAPAVVEVGNG